MERPYGYDLHEMISIIFVCPGPSQCIVFYAEQCALFIDLNSSKYIMRSSSFTGFISLAILLVIFLPVHAEIMVNPAYHAGEEIIISGSTNFNTDNSVLVEVWPASFGPKGKFEPSMEGGGSVIVPVLKMEDSRFQWSAAFDPAGWAPDTYMIRAEIIGKGYIETTTIELVGKKADYVPEPTLAQVHSDISHNKTEPVISPVETEKAQVEQTSEPVPVPTQKSCLNGMTIAVSLFLVIMCQAVYQARR